MVLLGKGGCERAEAPEGSERGSQRRALCPLNPGRCPGVGIKGQTGKLQLQTSPEFVSPLAPAPRLRSETTSWMSWNFLWPQALPPARPRKDFLIIPAAFHSKFMEYPRGICLATARLTSSQRAGVEERRQRSSEASRERQGLRKAVYLLIIGSSLLLSTKPRSSPTPRYQCVLNAFSSH